MGSEVASCHPAQPIYVVDELIDRAGRLNESDKSSYFSSDFAVH